MYKHLLVPTDGSELSTLTISRAVAFAKSINAKITFFYAAKDFLATGEGAAFQTVAPSIVSDNIAGDAHPVLMKAEAAARASNVAYRSIYRISDRPHEAIIKAAEDEGCDMIFMASRGPKKVGPIMVGSVTLKVLVDSKIPVLVSSVQRNASTPHMDKAITVIQDEHRSLAAILHAMRHLTDKALAEGTGPDFKLLSLMLSYIREFPNKLHHPKEDAYLFSRLRERTSEFDETLSALSANHADEHRILQQLEYALHQYHSGGADAAAAFSSALTEYTEELWRHMALEEQVILAGAKEHLLPSDWQAIAEAFGKNGDPRFGSEPDTEFFAMFAKLTRLSQSLNQP
ncbi:MAG: universal stress protein [Azoarcus sp.]|jgi:hemerythrin-like domain-containing protein/nucleotide-binding universal stress UspA family protein|nr:universal stress protein [Azoarcus sp.]